MAALAVALAAMVWQECTGADTSGGLANQPRHTAVLAGGGVFSRVLVEVQSEHKVLVQTTEFNCRPRLTF